MTYSLTWCKPLRVFRLDCATTGSSRPVSAAWYAIVLISADLQPRAYPALKEA